MKRLSGPLWLGLLPPQTAYGGEEQIRLKDGPGKELVEANCTACHSLDYIQMNSPFLDKKGWEATVAKMMNAMGAPVPKPKRMRRKSWSTSASPMATKSNWRYSR